MTTNTNTNLTEESRSQISLLAAIFTEGVRVSQALDMLDEVPMQPIAHAAAERFLIQSKRARINTKGPSALREATTALEEALRAKSALENARRHLRHTLKALQLVHRMEAEFQPTGVTNEHNEEVT